MAFCQNCGKELAEGARFCDGCGKAVSTVAEDGTKRSIKFKDADIIKCPNCGQDGLSRFDTSCPSCGFKFEAKERSKAVDELGKKLSECNGDLKQELSVVQSFNCPNNVQDMLELIIFASDKAKMLKSYEPSMKVQMGFATDYSKPLRNAYLGLIESISAKATLMFGDTAEGKRLQEVAETFHKKSNGLSEKAKKGIVAGIIAGIILIVSIIIPLVIT